MIKTKKRPFVAIIIVNLNKKEILKKCLDSLYKKTKYKNYVVIVSDNGSTDGSVEMIKKEFKRVDLIENRKNLGFALANNVAVDYALRKYNPDYFFLLNNDTKIIQKDWLTKLVETAESDERIGIVGCNLIYPDGSLQHFSIGGVSYYLDRGVRVELNEDEKKEANKLQEIRHNVGAAFLVKRSLIDKIGLFDRFFPYYGEEIDYCERVWKNGFKVIYDPRVTIIHIRAQTVDAKKITKDWYIMKKQSIKVELLNYKLKEIFYWQFVHWASIFISKRGRKLLFNWNFLERFFLLLKAYLDNLPCLPGYLYKRKHRDKKIFVLK